MDRRGIAAAVVSVSAPGVYFEHPGAGVGLARELARAGNEFVAGMARRHPARFGALGILPFPDAGGAMDELAHAYDVLGVEGVTLQASVGRQYGRRSRGERAAALSGAGGADGTAGVMGRSERRG